MNHVRLAFSHSTLELPPVSSAGVADIGHAAHAGATRPIATRNHHEERGEALFMVRIYPRSREHSTQHWGVLPGAARMPARSDHLLTFLRLNGSPMPLL